MCQPLENISELTYLFLFCTLNNKSSSIGMKNLKQGIFNIMYKMYCQTSVFKNNKQLKNLMNCFHIFIFTSQFKLFINIGTQIIILLPT